MRKLVLVFLLVCLPVVASAEPLGSGSKPLQFREKITEALGLRAGTSSLLVDVIVKHIDNTGDWSLKFMSGKDVYGDAYLQQPMRYFTAIIVKNGRTVVDTLTYNAATGQLLLSEVENIVMSISAGIEDSKKMASDPAYMKISESKDSAIYHKKGYLQDVAYSVNEKTGAIVKTYTDTFKETLPVSARVAKPETMPKQSKK